MTKKIAMLKRIREVRGQVRDAAAADVAAANARCDSESRTLTHAVGALSDAMGSAAPRLEGARNIRELEQVADEITGERCYVEDARRRVEVARTATNVASRTLRSRESEYRTTEKMLDRVSTAHAKQVDRQEQAFADEITATRFGKTL